MNKTEYKSTVMQEIFGSKVTNENANAISTLQETKSRAKVSCVKENDESLQIELSKYTVRQRNLLTEAGLLTCAMLQLISIVRHEKEILDIANDFELVEYKKKSPNWTVYNYYIAPVIKSITPTIKGVLGQNK